MKWRSWILGILLIVIVFLFAIGGMAIYASTTDAYEKKETASSSAGYSAYSGYSNQIIINKYESQPTVIQNAPADCGQQVTHYANNQPVIECRPSSQQNYLGQPVTSTKVNVYVSGSGYSPYPYRYYKPYYRPYPYYPKYYWYPKHGGSYYPYGKYSW